MLESKADTPCDEDSNSALEVDYYAGNKSNTIYGHFAPFRRVPWDGSSYSFLDVSQN